MVTSPDNWPHVWTRFYNFRFFKKHLEGRRQRRPSFFACNSLGEVSGPENYSSYGIAQVGRGQVQD